MSRHSEATDTAGGPATLTVTNLGGIDDTTVEFSPGVTLLAGRNATNRTSLLRALNGVLGGTAASLKSGTEAGRVTLSIGGHEHTCAYERTPTGVETDSEPYTDSETLIDLFATLLEDNPVREAVERGDDLHPIVMRPVDTEAIERRIRELQQEKQELATELDRVERRRNDLRHLEERRRELEAEIDVVDDHLDALRDEVADVEAAVDAAEEAEALVDELDVRRQELSRTEDELEVVEAELDALRNDRKEREKLADGFEGESPDLATELESLREQKRRLDDIIASLTTIADFNENVLCQDGPDLPGIEPVDEAVTAGLAQDEAHEVVCWTCGSRMNRGSIDERLDDLRTVIEEKRAEVEALDERIETLDEQCRTHERRQQRRRELDREIETTEEKISQRERRRDELATEIDGIRDGIRDLEREVAESEALRESDLLEKYERLNDRQYERGQLQQRLEGVNEEIADIEALPEPSELEAQRDQLTQALERERNRTADLEEQAVESFNEHMEELLAALEYENIERVWIERKRQDQRRNPPDTVFELHIVREDASGAVYEDVVDHLSESERETVGLVVALAGYLAHEAYQVVPFVLLDSVEAIDADRIAELVTYFAEYAPYLVVAVLPEDAEALSDDYERITSDALAA